MIALYPWLRFAKVLGVAMLFAGTIGAVLPRDLADRRRFAYAVAGPGFGLTWASGFALVSMLEVGVLTWRVCGGIALSLFSIQVVLYAVGKEGRRTPLVALLALAPLVAAVALMVWKPGE
jgi:hypothetical protein